LNNSPQVAVAFIDDGLPATRYAANKRSIGMEKLRVWRKRVWKKRIWRKRVSRKISWRKSVWRNRVWRSRGWEREIVETSMAMEKRK